MPNKNLSELMLRRKGKVLLDRINTNRNILITWYRFYFTYCRLYLNGYCS